MLKNKRGFLSTFEMMHPGLMFLIGLMLGMAIAYILVAKNIIPLNLLPAVLK